jgi:hypothetical protein
LLLWIGPQRCTQYPPLLPRGLDRTMVIVLPNPLHGSGRLHASKRREVSESSSRPPDTSVTCNFHSFTSRSFECPSQHHECVAAVGRCAEVGPPNPVVTPSKCRWITTQQVHPVVWLKRRARPSQASRPNPHAVGQLHYPFTLGPHSSQDRGFMLVGRNASSRTGPSPPRAGLCGESREREGSRGRGPCQCPPGRRVGSGGLHSEG